MGETGSTIGIMDEHSDVRHTLSDDNSQDDDNLEPTNSVTYFSPEERVTRHNLVLLSDAVNNPNNIRFLDNNSLDEGDRAILSKFIESDDISPGGKIRQTLDYDPRSHMGVRAYTRYVGILRKIRQEQASDPYVTQQLAVVRTTADPEERRALYLDAMSFSSSVSKKTLQFLDTRGRKLFTDEQIVEASKNPEAFQQTVRQTIIQNPGLAANAFDALSLLVPIESIRSAFEVAIQDDVYMTGIYGDSLPTLLQKMYPEEDRYRIMLILAKKQSGQFLSSLFESKWKDVVSAESCREFARKIMLDDDYSPRTDELEKGITLGYWTIEEIDELVERRFSKDPSDYALQSIVAVTGISPDNVRQVKEYRFKELMNDIGSVRDWSFDTLDDTQVEQLLARSIEYDRAGAVGRLNATIDKRLPPEVVRELYMEYMTNPAQDRIGMEAVLTTATLSDDEKRMYFHAIAMSRPQEFLGCFNFSKSTGERLFGSDVFAAEVQRAFYQSPFQEVVYSLGIYIEYFEDTERLKRCIEQGMVEGNIEAITIARHGELKGLFTAEELKDILFRAADNVDIQQISSSIIDSAEELYGVEGAKALLDKLKTKYPVDSLYAVSANARFYTQSELTDYLETVVSTVNGKQALVNILSVTRFIDSEAARKLIQSTMDGSIDDILILRREYLELHIGQDGVKAMLEDILERNPALALIEKEVFGSYDIAIDEGLLIDTALTDTSKMTAIGGYLNETLTRVKKTQNENLKNRLLVSAAKAYKGVAELDSYGLGDTFREMVGRLQTSGSEDRITMETFLAMKELGVSDTAYDINSSQELRIEAMRALAQKLGIGEISELQAQTAEAMLERSNSMLVYTTKMLDSDGHRRVLAPMFESMMDGDEGYRHWRFGGTSAEDIRVLQDKKQLPKNLTVEQYGIWQQEENSSLSEAFTVEAGNVVTQIGEIITTSIPELPMGSVADQGRLHEAIAESAEEIAVIGRDIAQVHKELQLLRAESDQSLTESQIAELKSRAAMLNTMRSESQIRHDLSLLMDLSSEAVAAGSVVKAGKNTTPLPAVLQRLTKNLGSERATVVDRIRSLLDDYQTQTGVTREVTVVDTANPRLTLEIGSSPVESCQNYRDGIYKECLLGYTDPNTKVIILKGESGRPIARSIFRLLETAQGTPALHLETIYTAQAGDAITRAIQVHAIAKARKMGIPLYTSVRSQNDQGELVEMQRSRGIRYTPAPKAELSSGGARAPYVYVDSAGAKNPQGVYKILGLTQLSQV